MPVSTAATDWDERRDEPGRRWARLSLGRRLGCELLGASVYEIAAGHGTWPFHIHHANEELLLVLSGVATVRGAGGDVTVQAGEAMAFPRGERGAHEVRNDSGEPCRVLIVSTMIEPDVAHYPDSDRYVLFAGAPPVPGETAPIERPLMPAS